MHAGFPVDASVLLYISCNAKCKCQTQLTLKPFRFLKQDSISKEFAAQVHMRPATVLKGCTLKLHKRQNISAQKVPIPNSLKDLATRPPVSPLPQLAGTASAR